jgi:uncharacterized protein
MSEMMRERILDSDTHCVEKPDVWTSRLPKAWGDQVMHMGFDEKTQREMWYVGDVSVNHGWPNAFYGTDPGGAKDVRRNPPTMARVHPSCYDAKARAKVMDEWGVEVAVLYPNGAGFALEPFLNHNDPEIAAAHLSAYNDFLLEEWCAAMPGRFIPMAVVSYWDVPRAVKEIERIAGKGFGGIVTTGVPQLHGQPYLRDRHWDRFWAAAQEAGLPFAFHVANGDPTPFQAEELVSQEDVNVTETRVSFDMYVDNAIQTMDLLMSGVLHRYPRLKFIISESGLGWVPFMLEAADERFKRQKVRLPEFGDMLPSQFFFRQIFVNTFFEHLTDWHIEHCGRNNIMFQTDIPHPPAWYSGGSTDFENDAVNFTAGNLNPQDRHRVLWQNGADLYADCLKAQGVDI